MVQKYQALVYTVCHQLVPDVQEAQDLTQETFLAAWRAIDRCPPGFEKQWLARIAANKAKDYLRSAWVRKMNTPGDEVLALEGAPPGMQPEQQVLEALGAIVFYNNIIMRVLGDVMWRWGQDNPVFRAIYLMLDALPQIVVCVALIVCGMWLVRGPKNKKGKQPAEEEPEDFHAYTAAPQAEDAEDAEDAEGTADTDAHFAMPELSALLGKPVTGAEQDETPAEDDDDRAE